MEGLFVILIGVFLYFLPSIVGRNKRNAGAIFVLNLLAGWTLVGWVVAIVWACTSDPIIPPITIQQSGPPLAIQQAALPPALFCSGCGKYSATGSRFCSTCGQTFASV